MHKISVVTINRNNADGLEKTILSVINQTYDNIEYIIIDGASTDSSVDIIKKYEKHISYWVSEPDAGIYDAMNKSIEKAAGEWINFMNSGDIFANNNVLENIFTPNHTEILNADIIYGNTIQIIPNIAFLVKAGNINTIDQDKPFCHQSAFVRTDVHKKYLFNTEYKICADYDFFYKAYNCGLIFKHVDETVAIFNCIGSYSAYDTFITVKEHCVIKNIKSKKTLYRLILNKKIRVNFFNIIDFLCTHNKFILKLRIRRMESKPNIAWAKINNLDENNLLSL